MTKTDWKLFSLSIIKYTYIAQDREEAANVLENVYKNNKIEDVGVYVKFSVSRTQQSSLSEQFSCGELFSLFDRWH